MNTLMKTCTTCGESKPLNRFSRRRMSRDGLNSQCKACRAEYNRRCPPWTRRKYGLSPDEYKALVSCPCEICGEAKGRGRGNMVIDHTIDGTYNGVLCHRCNTAIGLLQHDANWIRESVSYFNGEDKIAQSAAAYVQRTRP